MSEAIKKAENFVKETLREKEIRNKILMYGILILILTAACGMKGIGAGKHYVLNDNGKLVGLSRDDAGETATFPLDLRAEGYGACQDREVTVTLKGEVPDDLEKETVESPEDQLSRRVDQSLQEIGNSQEQVTMLPDRIGDDITLDWKIPKNHTFLLIPLFFPILVYGTIRSRNKAKENEIKRREENIRKELPAFNHQLLVLTGSGLIFTDAFRYIAESYEERGKAADSFRSMIVQIQKETAESTHDLISVLRRKSQEINERSWSRVVSVIAESQLRGTDLGIALAVESEMLWEQRKKMAEEKGKLAETRLTFPLAILLMVLILVTAAPAVIQVQGS